MTTETDTLGIAHGRLIALEGDHIVFEPDHSSYQLHLVPTSPIQADVGKRLVGIIEGRALQVSVARAGGTFLEPLWGPPRIVQGRVRAVDAAGNRLLIVAATPMWVRLGDIGQAASGLVPGQMVNFYMQSGTTFTPVHGH